MILGVHNLNTSRPSSKEILRLTVILCALLKLIFNRFSCDFYNLRQDINHPGSEVTRDSGELLGTVVDFYSTQLFSTL